MVFDPFLQVGCFRLDFPAFKDSVKWPNSVIEIALSEASIETSGSRWGEFQGTPTNRRKRGLYLYAAHWLACYYPGGASDVSAQASANGGQVASKSIGDESVSYSNASPGSIDDAAKAWLLKTQYGAQFLTLRKRALMGGFTV